MAFAWPATQLAPRSLPVVVAGPAEATAQVTAALDKAVPGGFAVTTVADEAAARAAIERRDAYGAIVLGQAPTVLTASAASPVVAQLMTQLATTLEARQPGAAAPASGSSTSCRRRPPTRAASASPRSRCRWSSAGSSSGPR